MNKPGDDNTPSADAAIEDDQVAALNETLAEMEQDLRHANHKLANEQMKTTYLKSLLETLWRACDETPQNHDIKFKIAQILFPHWFPADCVLPVLALGGLAAGGGILG